MLIVPPEEEFDELSIKFVIVPLLRWLAEALTSASESAASLSNR